MMELDVAGIGMTSKRTRLRLVERLRQAGISDESVLNLISEVPRHLFVDEALSHRAYEDVALPIGYGQTISQPYIVAKMTAAVLANGQCDNILEIGTGSGYQTAILSHLCQQVTTIERIAPFYRRASTLLKRMAYRNVRFIHADGHQGYQQYAPYDGIVVTASPEVVPNALLQQLADAGRLIIPVGDESSQELRVISRHGQSFQSMTLELVKFVPLLTGLES